MSTVKHLIISHSDRILVDVKNHKMKGDFVTILGRVLKTSEATPKVDNFAVVKMHDHIFSIYESRKVSFVCMCDEEYGEEMSKIFLRNLSDKFFSVYPKISEVELVTFQKFSATALSIMQQFSRNDGPIDKLTKAEEAIEGVTDVVKKNIDLAVRGQENLEDLQERAERVNLVANRFSNSSSKLERRLCWGKVKLKLFLVLMTIVVLYFIAASFCGLSLRAC